ncbi:MAG: hypothetical protein FJ149_11690 [Euryarchaeota archaeon]|nr:hypothetical protein [Euryarchaeota archaeon]
MANRRRTYQHRPNRGDTSKRVRMLDMGRMNSFMFAAEDIFKQLPVQDPGFPSILASIAAKASRMSIEDAQKYIKEKVVEGRLPKEAEEPLCRLLDRYSRWR